MLAELADTDPVALALGWLRDHPRVRAEFGGPGHVSGLIEAPWPRCRVLDGATAGLGDLTYAVTPEVAVEVYGDPAGTLGKASVRRLLLIALAALKELDSVPHTPGEPVVSLVLPSGTFAYQPLLNGQHRYTSGVSVTVRPADV